MSEVKTNKKTVNKYKKNSLGPFTVTIQGTEGSNVGNLHPMAIAKELLQLNIPHKKGPLRKGRNRITIEFDSPEFANKFLETRELLEKGFEMFIPSVNVSCRAVVRGVYKDLTVEEIKENSESKVEILEITRLKRRVVINNKTEYIPTGTCLFRFEGKLVPNSVKIFGLEMNTEPYMLKVIQCYNCLLYGHIKNQCRGKTKCQKCSKVHDGSCSAEVRCLHCNSDFHMSTEREKCPEYERQKQIRFYMSKNALSFYDANQMVPTIKKFRGDFEEQEFPRLNNHEENLKRHMEGEKSYLTHAIDNGFKPSFSRVTSYKRQKTRSPSPQPGFSREKVRECLYTPEARTKFSPLQAYRSINQQNKKGAELNEGGSKEGIFVVRDIWNNYDKEGLSQKQISQVESVLNRHISEFNKYLESLRYSSGSFNYGERREKSQ